MGDPVSVIGAVGSVLGGIGALASATKKPPKAEPAPSVDAKAPAVMPAPDDQAAQAAARRRVAGIQNRSGRQSTVLSQAGDNDTLG